MTKLVLSVLVVVVTLCPIIVFAQKSQTTVSTVKVPAGSPW